VDGHDDLVRLIAERSGRPASTALHALADAVRARHGAAVRAIIVYGSCYRTGDDRGIVDLYVLVDSYRRFYGRRAAALANRVLPPNVFSLRIDGPDQPWRAKYAVLSLADLKRGTSARAFHSYFWGRLAQPVGLLYASDARVAAAVHAALADAVRTFLARVVPLVHGRVDASTLWRRGLALSYAAELRAERRESVERLYDFDAPYYEAITRAVLTNPPWGLDCIPDAGTARYDNRPPLVRRLVTRAAWVLRCAAGKGLSVLRLCKGLFTFDGAVDYVRWKIERHSGVRLELSPRARRHVLVAGWVAAWRLYRRGGFR
jgi:hypothetical protein